MQTTAMIVIGYGLLVLVGGALGYVKAKSLPSLISGVVFGLALLISGAGIWQGSKASPTIALLLAAVLLVMMGMRYLKTKKFMPAGMIAVLSAVVVVVLVISMRG